mmetsp:Transcript_18519/g.30312  ORF Transcript_18519/g.30312 Transcript_18519/m.30312 type:complete len:458 (+) Transcript_18519:1656-3029(+)
MLKIESFANLQVPAHGPISRPCGMSEMGHAAVVDDVVSRSQLLANHIPEANTPIRYIPVMFHSFLMSDGRGFFQEWAKQAVRDLFDMVNVTYANRKTPDYSVTCASTPLPEQGIDSRIRFCLKAVEYYYDDGLAQLAGGSTAKYNAAVARNPDAADCINIYITRPASMPNAWGWALPPSSTDLQRKHYVESFFGDAFPGCYDLYYQTAFAWHLGHELGHILGLKHTYYKYGPNGNHIVAPGDPISDETHQFYLYDLHGCGADKQVPLPPNNNVMGGGHADVFSTLQIARMHYALDHQSPGKYERSTPCTDCILFGARIESLKTTGDGRNVIFDTIMSNSGASWDGEAFYAPYDGIYQFSLSFMKNALVNGATPNDIWCKIIRNDPWDHLATVWSEPSDMKTKWSPGAQQFGRRDCVSTTINVQLAAGSRISVLVDSDDKGPVDLTDVTFGGQLLCKN